MWNLVRSAGTPGSPASQLVPAAPMPAVVAGGVVLAGTVCLTTATTTASRMPGNRHPRGGRCPIRPGAAPRPDRRRGHGLRRDRLSVTRSRVATYAHPTVFDALLARVSTTKWPSMRTDPGRTGGQVMRARRSEALRA